MKENDYIVRIWPSGMITMGTAVWVNGFTLLMFKALETYSYEGGVVRNDIYGVINVPNTRNYSHRLATDTEIEVFKKFGTIQSMKEDYRNIQLEKLEI